MIYRNRHSRERGNPAVIRNDGKALLCLHTGKNRNGTLYLGVTSDIVKRVWQHKNGLAEGFTKKYGIKRLVYYEIHKDAENAIKREKQLKKWRRAWKLELIEEKNSEWHDLYADICQ